MSDQPVIRRAAVADVDTLVRLRLALFQELAESGEDPTPWEQAADATRRYLEAKLSSGEFLAWIAEVQGAIVSTSGLVFFEPPPSPHSLAGLDAYVMNMYTVPEWRGRGLAGAVLRELIAYVRTTAARRIWLYATDAGRPVYVAAGFVADGTAMELVW